MRRRWKCRLRTDGNVSRILRTERTTFRGDTRSALSVSGKGTPRGASVLILRTGDESGLPCFDCTAGNGEDQSLVSLAGKISYFGTHSIRFSNPMHVAGADALRAGGVGLRQQ